MSRVEKIADQVFVLSDIMPINGRVSWLPTSAKGFEPYNAYVLLTDQAALLVDTGFAIHGPSLVPSLREIIGSRRLAVYATRIELDSIGNLGRILEEIPGTIVGSANPVVPVTLVHTSDWETPDAPFTKYFIGDHLVELGFPHVRVVDPAIRTLGTSWLWDERAEILFSADFFCSDMMESPDQSVIRKSGEALIAGKCLRVSILQKFDWLALADTRNLARAWDALFAVHPNVIAPIRGRVQYGEAIVKSVIDAYREALFEFETMSGGEHFDTAVSTRDVGL
jgi:flavorubredoxin